MGAFDDLIPEPSGAFDDLIPKARETPAPVREPISPARETLLHPATPPNAFEDLVPPSAPSITTAPPAHPPAAPRVPETLRPVEPLSIRTVFPATSTLFDTIPSRVKAATFPFRVAWDAISIPFRTLQSIEHLSEGTDLKTAIRLGFKDAPLRDEERQRMESLLWNATLLHGGVKSLTAREFKSFVKTIANKAKGAPSFTLAIPRATPAEIAALSPVARKAVLQAVETVSSRVGELPTASEVALARAESLVGPTRPLKTSQQLALERLGLPETTLQAPIRERAVLADQLEEIASPRPRQAALQASPAPAAQLPGVSITPTEARMGQPTRFAERVKLDPETPQEMSQGIRSVYSPLTNKATIDQAQRMITSDPQAALTQVMEGEFSALNLTAGELLMKRARASGDYDTAINLAESISEKATAAGQGIQALSLWSRLSPEGVLRYAARVFQRANQARASVVKRIPKHKDTAGKTLTTLFQDAL